MRETRGQRMMVRGRNATARPKMKSSDRWTEDDEGPQ